MNKIIYPFFFFLFTNVNLSFGAGGFFDSFAIVNLNGTTTFYDLNATTINPDYQSSNLGSVSPGASSLILGGQTKTFKNNGTDITEVSIFYRIYPVGSPSGTFTEIPYPFQWNNGDVGAPGNLNGGDQQWGTDVQGANGTDGGVDILNGSTLTAGDYTLEVYVRARTNGTDAANEIFDSNGGSNYTANFTVTANLPVELTYFNAKSNNNQTLLSWQTASEQNNSHFEIQRSTDGQTFKTIGRVEGNGDSVERVDYEFVDERPFSGINYYRLMQVDFDGGFEYSEIASVRFGDVGGVSVFPNPVSDVLFIQFEEEPLGSYFIDLYSLDGRLLDRQNFEAWTTQATYPMTEVEKGIYILDIVTETGQSIAKKRIVK